MKKILTIACLILPIVVLAFHYGPGREGRARDLAAATLEKARAAERAEQWTAAVDTYQEALNALPKDDVAAQWKIRLAKANARVFTGQLPEAMQDMQSLLADVQKANGDKALVADVRQSLATAQYYAGWLMRLEGASREEWTVEVDQSRQNFRLLAEEARNADSSRVDEHEKNLESVIRLARMDLAELQGLPLPKQCQGCKNCSQKCRSQRESKKKEPSEQPKDARNAGGGKRPDGSGS